MKDFMKKLNFKKLDFCHCAKYKKALAKRLYNNNNNNICFNAIIPAGRGWQFLL